jgi:periplasmic protein TonB
MFATDRDFPCDDRSRRRWTSLASFAVEMGIVSGLLLLPLLEPQALPPLRAIESLPVLSAPAEQPARAPVPARGDFRSHPSGYILLAPTEVPREIPNLGESDTPPSLELLGGHGAEGGMGSNNLGDSLFAGIGTGSGPSLAPARPVPSNHPPRISHAMEGSLIHQVQPEYPPLAKQARVEGTVVLRAVIDREGKIENLQVLGGHPMLVAAALRAVEQWRYRPYRLNEQPVEVETLITVHFTLSGE